jgi:predicted aldo/keto reductase-like oxidoreductase
MGWILIAHWAIYVKNEDLTLCFSLSKDKQANNCGECFECEEKCPQGIPISEHLKEAHAWLDKKK